MKQRTRRTKIVCTLGPATHTPELLAQMVKAGMNVARLNFSHGSHEDHDALIRLVRSASAAAGIPVGILQDLQGPKIRLGALPEDGVELAAGSEVVFDTAASEYSAPTLPVDYADLHTQVKAGERLLLSDGRVGTTIIKVEGTAIHARVENTGTLMSHQGINIPDSVLSISALTDKDRADARFGVQNGVDMIALSFVTSAQDIIDLRYLVKEYEQALPEPPDQPIRIIAKIERAAAVEHIDEILDAADGIMVARGDLGIEIPAEDVPLVQKRLIDRALLAAKPVIVATQMLDSMQHAPRPTRAEVSDVANAVIDHTDAVMLSNETATGAYPLEALSTMARIVLKTETSPYDDLPAQTQTKDKHTIDTVMSQMSRLMAEEVDAALILAASLSGETGRLISRSRPELPIMVATGSERTARQLCLSWGVHPFILPPCKTIEELVERSTSYLKQQRYLKEGQRFIVVAGEPVGESGHVNVLEVREA